MLRQKLSNHPEGVSPLYEGCAQNISPEVSEFATSGKVVWGDPYTEVIRQLAEKVWTDEHERDIIWDWIVSK